MQPAVAEDGGSLPSATGGWLSPEGRYWPCPDCEHQKAAEAIVRDAGLPTGRDAEKVLEEAGWVHISDNGMVQSFLGASVLVRERSEREGLPRRCRTTRTARGRLRSTSFGSSRPS
jgi:hypothetical protein